jgi:glycosyltransferase involved in cell wall biosynthesis
VDLFIKAAAEINKNYKNIYYIIIGDGELKAGLIALADKLNIRQKIKFVGLQIDIIPYLSIFDIAILCSDSEGFSNALLEYTAAGVPTISTRIGSNIELLGEDGAGIFVPAGDHQALAEATENLLRDKQLRNSIREKALYRVSSKFSLQSMLENTELFYLNLFKEFRQSK